MSKLVIQPSFRVVDQTHAEWQTFEKLKNKRQMYGSLPEPDCLTFVFQMSAISRVFGQQL